MSDVRLSNSKSFSFLFSALFHVLNQTGAQLRQQEIHRLETSRLDLSGSLSLSLLLARPSAHVPRS